MVSPNLESGRGAHDLLLGACMSRAQTPLDVEDRTPSCHSRTSLLQFFSFAPETISLSSGISLPACEHINTILSPIKKTSLNPTSVSGYYALFLLPSQEKKNLSCIHLLHIVLFLFFLRLRLPLPLHFHC